MEETVRCFISYTHVFYQCHVQGSSIQINVQPHGHTGSDTFDGRNPKRPPGMYETL